MKTMSSGSGQNQDEMPTFLLENVPVIDEGSSGTPSPITPSLRGRNNLYSASGLSYPSMNYMKKRPYRTNSGAGTPVYSNIYQRYPSSKLSNPSKTPIDHTPKKDRSFSGGSNLNKPHMSNHSFEPNNFPYTSSTPKSNFSDHSGAIPVHSKYSINSDHPTLHYSTSNSSLNSKKLDFNNSKFGSKENLLADHDDDGNIVHYSVSSHSGSRNGMLFTRTPSSDNLNKARQQKKIHDSPSNFSDTNRSLKEKHRISTLGLGIKIPKSPDRSTDFGSDISNSALRTPDSNIFENSPIRNAEDFPLVNFSSRRSNASHKNSPASALRKSIIEDPIDNSPITGESDSSDDILADVVRDMPVANELDDLALNASDAALAGDISSRDVSGKEDNFKKDEEPHKKEKQGEIGNSEAKNRNGRSFSFNEKIMSMAEIDISRFSDSEDEENYLKKSGSKNLDKELYKSKNGKISGFKSPTTEEQEVTANIDDIFDNDNNFSSPFESVTTSSNIPPTFAGDTIEGPELPLKMNNKEPGNIDSRNDRRPISFMPSSEADAALESKIKSLLLMKKPFPTESIEQKKMEVETLNDIGNGLVIPDSEDPEKDSKLFNNKADLYLDRFPNFSIASDLISPPRSPTKAFSKPAISVPLNLPMNSKSIGTNATTDNNIGPSFFNEKDAGQKINGVEGSPKKASFHTRKDSQSLINWNVTDPAEWTISRVVFWLKLYGFNKSWVETFINYNVCREKFLELTNNDSFSKFNTYLKLNNEYLDFGPSDKGDDEGSSARKTSTGSLVNGNFETSKNSDDKADENPDTLSSSSSRFRYLLKKTIEEYRASPIDASAISLPEVGNGPMNAFGITDDLKLLSGSKKALDNIARHGRSNSDDINHLTKKKNNDLRLAGNKTRGFNVDASSMTGAIVTTNIQSGSSSQSLVNFPAGGTGSSSATSNSFNASNEITSGGALGNTKGGNKRLSYIKRPFSVIDASKAKTGSATGSKESPLSPYSSLFKRYSRNPEGAPTGIVFPTSTGGNVSSSNGAFNESHGTDDKSEGLEKKSGFLKKKLRKKEKIKTEFKQFSAVRKNSEGASPVSPVSSTSFETSRRQSKEIVGHIQLTDKQFPKPLRHKSLSYVLVTRDNETFVPVGSECLQSVTDFKKNLAKALSFSTTSMSKLSFHMTDYDSEYGEALDDSTIDSLIMFSFINYEVKFFVHCDSLFLSELTNSGTISTRSTKSSDTASFEIAADNRVAYPATPSSLINDGSHNTTNKKGEEVDYINFKGDAAYLQTSQYGASLPGSNLSKTNSNSSSLTADSITSVNTSKSSFSVIRPDANKREINFDKKRESPYTKNRVDLIPQRPAPAPPASSLQRSASVSKRISRSPLLSKDHGAFLATQEASSDKNLKLGNDGGGSESLKRSSTLLRRSSIRASLGNRASKLRNSLNSSSTFEENIISFEGVPSLEEESEESDGSDDSDDDFWAMAPKAKTENNSAVKSDRNLAASGSDSNVANKKSKKAEEFAEKRQATCNESKEKKASIIDNLKKKENKDKWVVRPSTDIVYDNLEQFFPNTDLDKPIIYEVDTPPVSPLDHIEKPPFSPINESGEKTGSLRKETVESVPNMGTVSNADEVLMMPDAGDNKRVSRNSRRKTIRGIAREYSIARKRESQLPEAKKNSALLRRQSTKLWGRKVVELTSMDMKYDYISKLKNNRGEMKNFAWIKGELIGIGTYGKVFLALNVTTGEMMAVKQVDIPRAGSPNKEMKDIIDALLLEVQTMKDLDHPNIVQYLGFEEVGNTYSLFLDYVAGGSVGSCLRMYGRFDEELIKFLTKQVTDGLSYLHSRGILHRDLKADNLLLDLDGICKITDFGISKRSENIYKNDSEMSMQGTIFWMAPEVIDNVVQNKKQGYSAKIDIWSLGCVVLEMFAGRRPWSNVEALSAMYRIGKTKLAPPIPDDVSPHVSVDGKQFLNQCFEIDPNRRPTALELFQNSPFCEVIDDFDFEKTKLAEMVKSNAKQVNKKPREFGRR
ncbi:hypothetical protein DASC09_036330 [Saccharomycopsis crataegensis]|uniref:mitogen-activated protein kinase kinase kinase n=1 Tax=Saccharomycopsis crataegensis TaxID=43959 RepID=A0AAV5QNE7_9ASCO|nr:hypothetical protein DASC09_036330 [Saccharomycopsis crataegensis]